MTEHNLKVGSQAIKDRVVRLEILQEMALVQTSRLETIVKEHMLQEELDRKEILAKLSTIEMARAGDKRYIGGIVFIISCLWAVITAAFGMWKGLH
jgi:hypothetical protein